MIALTRLRPYTGDRVAPSPNHDARRSQRIEGIVLHATQDLGHEARALSWLRSPSSCVSCHLLVSRTGRVTRLVGDQQRAWHAGLSWWRGTGDVNSITLGIEIANRNDGEPFTEAQYRRVGEIVAHYCRQGLSLADVVSHAAIAPGRKTDPLGWDWDRFDAAVQRRLWPAVESPPVVPRLPQPSAAHEVVSVIPIAPPRVVPPVATAAPVRPTRPVSAASPARPVIPVIPVTPVTPARTKKTKAPPVTAPPATAPSPQRVPTRTAAKPVLHSRTIWLNGLTMLAAAGAIVAESVKEAAGAGLTVPHVPHYLSKWVVLAVGLVNILLRLRTTCPVGGCNIIEHTVPDASMRSPGRGSALDQPEAVAARS